LSIPNIITLARLMAVPLTIWLIMSGELGIAFALFVLAGVSDAVDGYLAKRFNSSTPLGAVLDPIADKVLLVSVYVALAATDKLPLWLVILVVFRDLLIIGGALLVLALAQPVRWQPLMISKLNTTLQIVLVALVLARTGLGLDDFGISKPLIYIVAVTTFMSGAAYVIRWARGLSGLEEAP